MREFHIWRKMFAFSFRFGFRGLLIGFWFILVLLLSHGVFLEMQCLKVYKNFPTCLFTKGLALLFFPSPHS